MQGGDLHMKEKTTCMEAIAESLSRRYFAVAHLFSEEKTMDIHINNTYEIYYSISGGRQFLIDNRFYEVRPGDIFVINQFESHCLTQIDQMVHERIVISIAPGFLEDLSTGQTDLASCFKKREPDYSPRLSLSKEQQSRFMYIINKVITANNFGGDIIERAAFMELMVMINKVYHDQAGEEATAPVYQFNKQVEQIVNYINEHLLDEITIDRLSAQFFISPSYICRIFKETTGTTINRYINSRRITIAKSLLVTGLDVTRVFEQSGFNDYSNFIKTFTKSVGLSPKKYAKCGIS